MRLRVLASDLAVWLGSLALAGWLMRRSERRRSRRWAGVAPLSMQEALRMAWRRGVWARPVSWRGRGQAIARAAPQAGTWRLVPSLRGGEPVLLPPLDVLEGPWEAVPAHVVIEERGGAR